MKINVVEVKEELTLTFMPYGVNTKRLWIRDLSQFFSTVGRYCPHIHISGFECVDCSLNVE